MALGVLPLNLDMQIEVLEPGYHWKLENPLERIVGFSHPKSVKMGGVLAGKKFMSRVNISWTRELDSSMGLEVPWLPLEQSYLFRYLCNVIEQCYLYSSAIVIFTISGLGGGYDLLLWAVSERKLMDFFAIHIITPYFSLLPPPPIPLLLSIIPTLFSVCALNIIIIRYLYVLTKDAFCWRKMHRVLLTFYTGYIVVMDPYICLQ